MSQLYPYDENLSYHLVNLALVGGVQPLWETEVSQNSDLDDLFAIPRKYYNDLFPKSPRSADEIYADIHGYVRRHYELVGAVRFGQAVTPDYEEVDSNGPLPQSHGIEYMLKTITSYSQRVTESVSNSIRYNFSRLLMGYALRSKVDGHGIVVLRGTVTANEWLYNLNYRLVPFHPSDVLYGKIHNGFRDLYKGIRGRYRELVDQFDTEVPLYLVGHSLGAALAQLAALDIAVRSPERANHLRVYGYASPRVGDALFTSAYDRLVGTSYRVVNICDVIPYVPFEEIGTRISRQAYAYADTKGEVGFVHQSGDPMTNHIGSYHIAVAMRVPAPIEASVPRRLT